MNFLERVRGFDERVRVFAPFNVVKAKGANHKDIFDEPGRNSRTILIQTRARIEIGLKFILFLINYILSCSFLIHDTTI